MIFCPPVPHVRRLFRLTLIVILFLLIGLTIKTLFLAAAREAIANTSSAPPLSPRAATVVAPVQTAQTLLALRFEGVLTGDQDETPTQASGVTFQSGASGQGLFMDRGNRLTYPSDGNINATEGTIELWIKPNWNGNDGQSHAILRYGNIGGILLSKEGNSLRLVLNRTPTDGSLQLDVGADIQSWQANQWHHVAASWSNAGQFLRLYIDGSLVSERSLAATLPAIDNIANPTLQLGGDFIRSSLLATVDEVFISSAARSSQEIATRMLQGITITGATLTPNISSVDMYPGWTYWQALQFSATTNLGTLMFPFQAATLTDSNAAIATTDPASGRIKAVAPGTATITATFNGTPFVITANVLAPQQAPTEETVDAALGTPMSGHLYKIPVVIIRYFPTTDGTNVDATVSGYTSTLDALKTKQTKLEKKLKFMLEEGSRFRGYVASPPAPSLGYQIVKIITVYEDIPPGLPVGTSGVYFPDYKQILNRFNAEDLVTNQGVKEIWLEQYVNGRIALDESNMSSPVTGDISSSLRTNDDLPVYSHSYTVFGINFAQSENNAGRNRGHHLEAILSHVNKLQDGNDSLFWDSFTGRNPDGSFQQGRCGKTDIPPNGTGNYDFNNLIPVDSDIEDWSPSSNGVLKSVSSTTWGNLVYAWPETPDAKTESQWYIYWMQAMPGRNNNILYFQTDRMTNWWHFTADWDSAIESGLGLYESAACQFTLSSTSKSFQGNGGSSSVNVTSGTNCNWSAATSETWIKLTNTSGSGSGTVNFTVDPATTARTGTIIIAGNVFTITQTACTFTFSPTSQNFTATGGDGSITLSVAPGSCAWTATSNAAWITISSGTNGTGNGTVNFTVAANAGAARTGTLTIGEQAYTITQSAANPVPAITSLSPNTATVGGGAFTLTVNGSNFVNGSVVRWNGSDRTTTFVNSTQLTAAITAADIATAGSANVNVFNPTPGGGTSNTLTFAINNPAPALTSLGPNTAIAGSGAFTLTVTGSNFVSGSIVRWNGTDRTTTFVSGTQLTAAITATDVAAAGNASVTVFNPTPGGGTSGTAGFTINNPVPTLSNLNPSTATAGGAAFTLTVTGTNFVNSSVVRWSGSNRTTTFVSSTQLTAAITAADIAAAGTPSVTVFNPTPGGGSSGALNFTVTLSCAYVLAPGSKDFTAAGGSDNVNVTAGAGCNWTATSNAGWITINSGGNGSGNGTVNYTVAANTGAARSGTMTIAGQTFTVNQESGCTYTLGATSQNVSASGTGGNVGVTTNSDCAWTAASNDAWLTISSGSSGTGNGTVNFNVAANTGPARSGTLTIAGQTFAVNQASGCVYTLNATSLTIAAAGGSSSVNVTANTGCAWTAISNASWLTLNSGSNGTGNGTVNFAIAANTGAARGGTMTIAGQPFTVNQDAEQTLCVAQRTLPTEYIPGLAFVVSVQASPAPGTQSYAVEDTPPAGWTVSGIDNGGQFDATNGKVKWGPFFDAQARTLTYSVTPPGGSSGQRTFSGTISVDGVSSAICGSSSIQAGNFVHPADLNNNLRIEINELTAYGAAWKSGATWSRPPNPIDINYLTNAGLIWKVGEAYHYDASQNPPFAPGAVSMNLQPNDRDYILDAVAQVFTDDTRPKSGPYAPEAGMPVVIAGGTATASFSASSYTPGVGITVTIVVTPDAGTNVYAVEETPPPGWVVSTISGGGAFDNTNKKVKWGPFFDNTARTLTYVVTPPAGETGNKSFLGSASLDGVSVAITGARMMANQSANTAPSIVAASALTRQQGANATAVTIATVSDAETAPGSLTITITSVPAGITVTEVTNNNGTVSAIVTASCLAAVGSNTIGLRVTDAQGATADAMLTINVTSSPGCFLQAPDASAGDQRIGSILLYSYYTSSISASALQNTQLRITNTHETLDVAVRLYFADGQFATVQSMFLCLPPNQTTNFLMSEIDPDVTGYVIAVAVDKTTGCPINFNYLTGGAYIKLNSGHTANLGAIAVAALAANPTACVTGSNVATLNFDGTSYARLPKMLVTDNLSSLKDGNDTRLIVTRIGGSLLGTAGALGAMYGKIYNSNRVAQNFTFSTSSPQLSNGLSVTFPRLSNRLDLFIPAGQSGWMKLWTDTNIGIIGAAINLPTNLRTPNGFAGGYNLQQGALAGAVSLDIPISAPTCQ